MADYYDDPYDFQPGAVGNPYDYQQTSYAVGNPDRGNPYDYEASTNPFIGPTTTYNPQSQTYVQVFDDGSTLETDVKGDVVKTTSATDRPGLADSISRLFSNLGQGAAKVLAQAFKKPDGSTDWGKIAALGGGLYGLLNRGSGGGGGGGAPSGYQGKIPTYTATRTRAPLTETMTVPPVAGSKEGPTTVPRQPGSFGRRYFSDVTYAPPTPPAAAPAAPAEPTTPAAPVEPVTAADGGLMQIARGRYLRGQTDGMEDKLRTTIDGSDPAALSHGEFIIPADVVSHLGNGNSDAGAKRLYQMMDRIRQARTGTKQQGKQINANKYLPT
jgi:hypothetical protein